MSAIPQIRKIYPFSKTNLYTVYFDISGISSQIVYNEIEIRENPNTGIIYQNRVQEFRYQHDIPLNTLVDGKQYSITMRIYDVNQVLLGTSPVELFYCFSIPVITIPTITNGEVNNQTVSFEGTYTQSQGELLQSYIYSLYDSNQILLSQSNEMYDDLLIYEFSELENNTSYYIELKILTINEMEITTGLIEFIPHYIAPKFNSFIQLENNPQNASVKLTCNVIRILGTNDTVISYENNEIVDLTNNHVYFQDGFSTSGNFVVKLWVKNININEVFFKLSTRDNITLELSLINNKIHLYKMRGEDYIVQHITVENEVIPTVDDIVFIDFRQINGLYNLTYSII